LRRADRLQVLRDFFEFEEGFLSRSPVFRDGVLETVIDVIVDQRFLCNGNGLLHGMQLLREIETLSARLDHLNDGSKVTLGAAKPFEKVGMCRVQMFGSHG
jgi:hypothetical protein